MDYELALRQEQEYTALVQQLLYAVVSRNREYADFHDESIRMMLADAWEELRVKPTALSTQDLEQLSGEIDRFLARKAFSEEQVRRYEKMLLNPFFARVDFKEENTDGDVEKIVIGLYSLKGTDGTLLVHDWRAPVCSLYYDAMPGKASYDSPSGIISGTMTLKRQYRMEEGRLRYFVDTDLSIDDSMLLDILSHATSAHMRNIVSTIQKEQNAAIRHDRADVLCVSGSAGSGKTSVAMHRAAYLMYHMRNSIEAKHIAVLSPSATFTEYVSGVLEELGEENTRMVVMHELYRTLIGHDVETMLHQQERLFGPEAQLRRASVAFKSGGEFCQMLEAFAKRFLTDGPAFSDVALGKQMLITRKEMENMYRVQFRMLTPAQRLSRIRAVADTRLENWAGTLSSQYEDRLLKDYKGETLELAKKLAVSQRLQPVRRALKEQLDIDPMRLYARACEGLPEKYCLAAEKNAQDRVIWWEDAPGIAYLLLRLGFAAPDRTIMHLLIDEAQDYPEIALRALHLYFNKARVTILGDPNQRTCPGMPPCECERWGECFGKSDAPLIKLEKCYRSTLPITRLCNALLPEGKGTQPIGRDGDWPQIAEYDAALVAKTAIAYAEGGAKYVAVVTREQRTAYLLAKRIPHAVTLTGDADDMMPDSGGIIVGSYPLMKGLEFDAVCAVWPEDVPLTDEERRRLYTACSRALHHLTLFAGRKTIEELGIVL